HSNIMLYKLVLLGANGVGKICLNHFSGTYDPTIEDSYRKQVVIDDHPCILEVLPIKGEYNTLRDQWIRDGQGFLLVYSISERSTFERIEHFWDQIARVKGTVDNVPIMLVGNKCDKITEREVSREEGMNMARRLNCEFIESSVLMCVNVERAFYTVVRMIRTNRDKKENNENEVIIKPDPTILLQKKKDLFFKLLS
ncbi:Ras2-like protein, partial [Rhizophagus irregularis]